MGLSLANAPVITSRWTNLVRHAKQERLFADKYRFKVVPAGRRSGKTEVAKRHQTVRAITFDKAPNGRFIFGAPTRQQAKKIYWLDIKAMVPQWALCDWLRNPISESELCINLFNGARIEVMGFDEPARAEGDPIDGIVLDEYGNMKEEVWSEHVRPGLTTAGRPPGYAWLIGVPEGRNHYYHIYQKAISGLKNWQGYTWHSSDILPPEEIEAAREELDELTFKQEYEADFITFAGKIYYNFNYDENTEKDLHKWYDPYKDLIFCFDFNVDPGTAVVVQELEYIGAKGNCADYVTAVIDEVFIPRASTTPQVCAMLTKKFKNHKGNVICYGDPAGGNRGTAQTQGSDWEIIKHYLKPVYEDRLKFNVTTSHPPERSRVNAVNSRIKSASNTIRLLTDPLTAVKTTQDLDGVRVDKNGHIDKRSDKSLTHLSDGLGYYIHRAFPADGSSRTLKSRQI